MARAGFENLEAAIDDTETCSQRLWNMAKAHATFHAKMSTAARVTNFEIRALQAERQQAVLEYYVKTEVHFRNCLRDGKNSGEFQLKDLTVTNSAIMSLMTAVCRWYQPDGPRSPEEIGDLYGDMVLAMARLEAPLPA